MAPKTNTLRLLSLATLLTTHLSAAQQQDRELTTSENFTPCTPQPHFNITLFQASISPSTSTLAYDLVGTNENFTGNTTIDFIVNIASRQVWKYTLDPCMETGWSGVFCPSTPGQINLNSNQNHPDGAFDSIPDSVYTAQDPDAEFRLVMRNRDTNQTIGCLEAALENGMGGSNGSNATDSESGSSNSTTSEGSNDTESSNQTRNGGNDDSGASTAYLNWTLLVSAIFAFAFI